MNIKPLGDRLVVERLEQEEKTVGGIIIPDSAKEKPKQAIVLAVGPGTKNKDGKYIAMDIAVGDVVLFTQWSGNEMKIGDKDYLFLKESEVIGIVENGASKKKAA